METHAKRGAWRPAGEYQSLASGEARLVFAILQQAIVDMKAGDVDARLFLTAARGSWAESQAKLCWTVDIDPDLLRAVAMRAFPGEATCRLSIATAASGPTLMERSIAALADGPLHARDVALAIGCEKPCAETALSTLLSRGRVVRVAPGSYCPGLATQRQRKGNWSQRSDQSSRRVRSMEGIVAAAR